MFQDRRTLTGTVVSTKMEKTVVVAVTRIKHHPLYRRTIRRTTKYKAHDPKNECHLGDLVRMVESHPISKDKRWLVVEIMKKGDVPELRPHEVGSTQATS